MKIIQIISTIFLLGIFGYAMSLATFGPSNIVFNYGEVSIPVSYPTFFGFLFGLIAAMVFLNFVFRTAKKKSQSGK